MMEEFKQNTAPVINEHKGKPYLMAAAKIIAFLIIMLIVSGVFSALLMVLVNISPVFGGWVLFHYLQEIAMLATSPLARSKRDSIFLVRAASDLSSRAR